MTKDDNSKDDYALYLHNCASKAIKRLQERTSTPGAFKRRISISNY